MTYNPDEWADLEKTRKELESQFQAIDKVSRFDGKFEKIQDDLDFESKLMVRQPNPYGKTTYYLHLENGERFEYKDPVIEASFRSDKLDLWNSMFQAMGLWAELHNSAIYCIFSTTGPLIENVRQYVGRGFNKYYGDDGMFNGPSPITLFLSKHLYLGPDKTIFETESRLCTECTKLAELKTGQNFWRYPE